MGAESAGKTSEKATPTLPIEPSLKPIGDASAPAGYAASAAVQSHCQPEELSAIAKLASKVRGDPLLMRQLCDRVCELMLEDLHRQRERSRHCGGFLQ